MTRKRSRTVVDYKPPAYPDRIYVPSLEETIGTGITSAEDLVHKMNARLRAAGRPPISVADFPICRSKFLRLLARWSRAS